MPGRETRLHLDDVGDRFRGAVGEGGFALERESRGEPVGGGDVSARHLDGVGVGALDVLEPAVGELVAERGASGGPDLLHETVAADAAGKPVDRRSDVDPRGEEDHGRPVGVERLGQRLREVDVLVHVGAFERAHGDGAERLLEDDAVGVVDQPPAVVDPVVRDDGVGHCAVARPEAAGGGEDAGGRPRRQQSPTCDGPVRRLRVPFVHAGPNAIGF